jgi:hypothetical protein
VAEDGSKNGRRGLPGGSLAKHPIYRGPTLPPHLYLLLAIPERISSVFIDSESTVLLVLLTYSCRAHRHGGGVEGF